MTNPIRLSFAVSCKLVRDVLPVDGGGGRDLCTQDRCLSTTAIDWIPARSPLVLPPRKIDSSQHNVKRITKDQRPNSIDSNCSPPPPVFNPILCNRKFFHNNSIVFFYTVTGGPFRSSFCLICLFFKLIISIANELVDWKSVRPWTRYIRVVVVGRLGALSFICSLLLLRSVIIFLFFVYYDSWKRYIGFKKKKNFQLYFCVLPSAAPCGPHPEWRIWRIYSAFCGVAIADVDDLFLVWRSKRSACVQCLFYCCSESGEFNVQLRIDGGNYRN